MRCKNTGLKWSFISNEQAGNPYIKDMICKQWGSVSQTTNIFIIYQVINLDRKCKHLFLAQKKLIMQTQKHSHEWVRKRNRGLTLQQATRAHTPAKPWRGTVGEEPCTWDDAEALATGSSYTSQPNNHSQPQRQQWMRERGKDETCTHRWKDSRHMEVRWACLNHKNLFARY